MRYRTFGRQTGLRVAELALGTASFGTRLGYGTEPDEARKIFASYIKAGGNFIDTSDRYHSGQSEELLGDFIAADRDHFVLASKYTVGAEQIAGISRNGNSRKSMVRAVEGSLRRLKTDRIDLYWVHVDDRVTPMEEMLRGLDDLVRSGKILYVGFSNFPAWRISRGSVLAELRGFAPIAGIQFEYSLVERTADRELLPMAEALGLGVVLWSPLGGGFLTGKYRQSEEGRLKEYKGYGAHTEKTPQETAVLDAVIDIAKEQGATPAQVSIAWLLHKAEASTTSIIPILGARKLEQLEEAFEAMNLSLTQEQVERLDVVSQVVLGNPHDIITQGSAQSEGGKLGVLRHPKIPVA
jgi:aryl-alcohol dehydrogenase-like predicted oxidoreductase